MNATQQTSDLEMAFADLVSAATRLIERGKPPRAAAVKAALLVQADSSFDEGRLGFPKFMAFLKAAEAAGHVEPELRLSAPMSMYCHGVLKSPCPIQRTGECDPTCGMPSLGGIGASSSFGIGRMGAPTESSRTSASRTCPMWPSFVLSARRILIASYQ